MNILRTYPGVKPGVWYAMCRREDGSTIELKLFQAAEPNKAAWHDLYDALAASEAAQSEMPFEVECEDGTIITSAPP